MTVPTHTSTAAPAGTGLGRERPAKATGTAPIPLPRPDLRSRELAVIGLVAIGFRIALAMIASALYHVPVRSFATRADGVSYMARAAAIMGDSSRMTAHDRRVFPGYSAAIAAGRAAGLPPDVAALAISWVASGVAAALCAALCNDRRMGWGMAFLIPHYVLYSSLAMNESLLLALVLLGLLLALRADRPVLGGVVLGLAGVVRPNACFAVLGYALDAARRRRMMRAALLAGAAAALVAAAMVVMHMAGGSALENARAYRDSPGAYNGELLTWPFKSLIYTPRTAHAPLWKVAYVWLHVVTVLGASAILAWRWARARPLPAIDGIFAPWLIGNTAFILCVGNVWGFQAFHRFASWALPPLLWAYRPLLPRTWWAWGTVAGFSALIVLGSYMKN